MARFQSGEWEKYYLVVRPTGWLRRLFTFPNGWSPPYLAGSKVAFEVELIDPFDRAKLFNMPFNVIYRPSVKAERVNIDSDIKETKRIFNEYSASGSADLEYWVGVPRSHGSLNIVQADTWNPTTLIVALLTAFFVQLLNLMF